MNKGLPGFFLPRQSTRTVANTIVPHPSPAGAACGAGRFAPVGDRAVSCTRGKRREAVRFGTVHSPCGKEKAHAATWASVPVVLMPGAAACGKEKAHAATWAKQNSYMRKDTP